MGALDAWSSAPSVWNYNYFVVCCHLDPLLHPPDTITPLLARLFAYQNLVARQRTTKHNIDTHSYFHAHHPQATCIHVHTLTPTHHSLPKSSSIDTTHTPLSPHTLTQLTIEDSGGGALRMGGGECGSVRPHV